MPISPIWGIKRYQRSCGKRKKLLGCSGLSPAA
jgi:hypothetical protein